MKNLCITVIVAALAVFNFHSSQADDHKHEHVGHMLDSYISVTDALFKSDLVAAKAAAAGIVEHDENCPLAAPAAKIARSEDLAAAREAFKTLSAEAIKMAEVHAKGKYTVMNCPMIKGGAGDWLSADGKVNNPYFGAKMPHCGGPKR